MSNNVLPKNLYKITEHCIKQIQSTSNTLNNLSSAEMALSYYSIYHDNKLHLILMNSANNGLSATFAQAAAVFEMLSYHHIDSLPGVLTTIHCLELIKSIAHESKKSSLLNMMIQESKPFAFCLTEEEAGSDISAIQTYAVKNNDTVTINGKKDIVINCSIASFYLVLAKGSKKGRAGLNVFLIPETVKGLRFDALHTVSFKNSIIGKMSFEDVVLDDTYQIGEDGSGYFLLTEMLDKGRPLAAACCVGGSQRAFDIIVAHAKKRIQFSKPLYEFQGINFPIAEFETRLHAARLLYLDACKKIDNNEPFSKEASMAKYYASTLFKDITNFGLEVFGYNSIFDTAEIRQLNYNAQAMMFIDGTANVQKMIIASLI